MMTAWETHVSIRCVVRMLRSSIAHSFRSELTSIWGGAVAQLGARVNGIHEVAGSIPASSTILLDITLLFRARPLLL